MTISVIVMHPLKAPIPIFVKEEGIEICVNDEQFLNAFFSMDVNEEGIEISVIELQS